MPYKPSSPCKHHGCPKLSVNQTGYCELHQSEYVDRSKWKEKERPNSAQRGYTGTWKQARVLFLRQNPVCACGRPAVLVHHVKPISEGGEVLDPDNFMSMCRECHEKEHGRYASRKT